MRTPTSSHLLDLMLQMMPQLYQRFARRCFFVLCVLFVTQLFGCAGGGSSTVSHGQGVRSLGYGKVIRVKRFESHEGAGTGALIGGVLGLGAAGGGSVTTQTVGAAGGGMAGGQTQKRVTKGKYVSKYSVRMSDGEVLEVVTKDSSIHGGECVAVERGEKLHLRSVSQSMCEDAPNPAGDNAALDAVLDQVEDCEQAKRDLAAADSRQNKEALYREMRAVCQ